MKSKQKKLGIVLTCISGLCAVAYGMAYNDNSAFLVGLILVIAGYLFIRKRLKDSGNEVP